MASDRSRLVLTPRGSGLLVAGLVVLLVGFLLANLLVFAVAAFLLGFLLAELIWFAAATRGFGASAFSTERRASSSFVSVGGYGLAAIEVRSTLPGTFYVELFDSYPDRLAVRDGAPRLVTAWNPGEALSLAYIVSPTRRGAFYLGPTVVTAHDTLGFAFKSVALPTPWPIEAIVPPKATGLVRPVRLPSRLIGQTWVSARGAGTDFRALREYEPGDEVRRLAWTRSTQGKLYVRENERESQQDLLVLLDQGREMGVGTEREDALDQAVDAMGGVLEATFEDGGRSGVAVFDRDVLAYDAPGRGASHEFRVFRTLTGAQVGPEASRLDVALEYLLPRLSRPTTILACSALGGDAGRLAVACGALRLKGHRLYLVAPDVPAMYPKIGTPIGRRAFDLLLGTELRRLRGAGAVLERAGGAVAWYGPHGVVEAVNQAYGRGQLRVEVR